MNCYSHPGEVAVASCIDCGKGLCRKCADLYQMPICNECNLKRVRNDKGNIIRVYLPSILLFVTGLGIGIYNGSLNMGFMLGYIFAGTPWGWKIVTFIQPRVFLFLPLLGWIFYFMIKLAFAVFVGLIALPIGFIRLIIGLISARSKEKNIQNNMAGNFEGTNQSPSTVNTVNDGSNVENTSQNSANTLDKSSMGFAILSFFFPFVGIILGLVWKRNMPLKAKSCGKGAFVGLLLFFVAPMLFMQYVYPMIPNFGPEKIKEFFSKPPQKESSSPNPIAKYAVVISDALNIRAGPSADNEIVGRLTKDDRIEILDNSGQWWKIKSGDVEGYVVSDYLRE